MQWAGKICSRGVAAALETHTSRHCVVSVDAKFQTIQKDFKIGDLVIKSEIITSHSENISINIESSCAA